MAGISAHAAGGAIAASNAMPARATANIVAACEVLLVALIISTLPQSLGARKVPSGLHKT
jgi:hypothetical protein